MLTLTVVGTATLTGLGVLSFAALALALLRLDIRRALRLSAAVGALIGAAMIASIALSAMIPSSAVLTP